MADPQPQVPPTTPAAGGRPSTNGTANNKQPYLSPEQFAALTEVMTNNVTSFRQRFWQAVLDPRRSVDDECGYPPDGASIGPELYRQLYEREPIAARIVQLMPKECWMNQPRVYESESTEDTTPFEIALENVGRGLRSGRSWHRGQEGNPIWGYCERANVLSGIGHFGIILLGIDDGRGLHEPAEGVCETPDGYARNEEINNLRSLKTDIVKNDYNPKTDSLRDALSELGRKPKRNPALMTEVRVSCLNETEQRIVGSWEGYANQVRNCQERLVEKGILSQDSAEAWTLKELWDWTRAWGYRQKMDPNLVVNAWAQAKDDPTVVERWEEVLNTAKDLVIRNTQTKTDDDSNVTFNAWAESAEDISTWGGNWNNTYGPGGAGTDGSYWDWLGGTSPAWSSHGSPAPWDVNKGKGNKDKATGGWQGITKQPLGTDQEYMGPQMGPVEMPAEEPAKERRNLLFMRAYSEDLVQIVRYEWNVRSPRFGMPTMYRVTLNDPREVHGGVGLPLATVFVHWSRVLHLARTQENAGSSDTHAAPIMRPNLNRVLDIRKLFGASAEGYWQSGVPGYSLETDPALGGEPVIDYERNKDQVEKYFNSMQKYMALNGMTAKMLAPSVVDPTPFINVQVKAICTQMACPVPVFEGYEIGEQASTNNDEAWNERKAGYMNSYLTPGVIVPLVDRLIAMAVLPEPTKESKVRNEALLTRVRAASKTGLVRLYGERVQVLNKANVRGQWKDIGAVSKGGYVVEWPDLEALGDAQKAQIAQQLTGALGIFVSQGSNAMTLRDYYVRVWKWSESEADAVIEALEKKQEEDQAAQLEEQEAALEEGTAAPAGDAEGWGDYQEEEAPPEEGEAAAAEEEPAAKEEEESPPPKVENVEPSLVVNEKTDDELYAEYRKSLLGGAL